MSAFGGKADMPFAWQSSTFAGVTVRGMLASQRQGTPMLTRIITAVTIVSALAFGGMVLAQDKPPPVSPSPVKRTVLGKVEVPNSNYEVITAMVEIAPGFKAGRHFHPGVVFFNIVEGEFWLAPDGQSEQVLKTSEGLTLPDKIVHNEGNASSEKPVKLIVTYVLEKGQPLVIPVK
jgi:quercetin dioxygenase-like cupin family protein